MADSAVIRWSSGDVSIVIDMTELVEIANQMPERAEKIVRQVAFRAEGNMKQKAAVDTGAMRESVFTEMVDSFTALVGPSVDYAIFIEFGHHGGKVAARPFVIPGAEAATRDLDRLIAELFE